MAVVNRSAKLGVASLVLLGGSCAFTMLRVDLPFGFALAVISFVLGLLAAQNGNKWWLVVPCLIAAVIAVLLYIGWHAV